MENTTPQEPVPWPPHRVALATIVVVLIAAAFWIFFSFRLVFFSLFTAVVLSTALEPLVDFMTRRGLSRPVSILLITLVFLLSVVVVLIIITPLISEQWATITTLVTGGYEDLRENLIRSPSLLVRRLGRQLPGALPLTLPPPDIEEVQGESLDVVERAMNTGTAVLRGIFTVFAVGLLTNYWMLEGERATRFFLLATPSARRDSIREFLGEIRGKVGAYTRGLVILCSIIGVMQLIAYLIIGLPNALLLGIVAGIMEAVPIVGPLLGAIPAFAVAAAVDPSKVLWVAISTMIIQMLENNLVAPRVMDRAVGVNPVASLLAFIAFGSIFGLVGALLAIPLAAVIQLVLNRVLFNANPMEIAPPVGRSSVSTLRYEAQNLAQDVRKQVRDKEDELDRGTDQLEDAMEAIVLDLDSILAQAEETTNGSQRQNQPRGGGARG